MLVGLVEVLVEESAFCSPAAFLEGPSLFFFEPGAIFRPSTRRVRSHGFLVGEQDISQGLFDLFVC